MSPPAFLENRSGVVASTKFVSLRLKLSASLAVLSLVIATGVVTMFVLQLEGVERAALLEAEHLANLIAFTASEDMGGTPALLKKYVEGLDKIYKRDVLIVDRDKRGIADANASEIGEVFTHDSGNEVTLTMGDGKVRTFVEKNELHVDGAKQLVVPLRKNQAQPDSAITGAVIVEYTQIYADLLDAERSDLHLSAALALACVLLATVLGFRVANKVVTGLKNLQLGVERVARGDYSASNFAPSADEIGVLAGAFNAMSKELDASRAELVIYQRDLEDRVVVRTSELHSANVLLQSEIKERKASAERIQYLAYYDSLTGLPNRRMFGELLTRSISQAMRHENPLAVLFIDLDRFKTINDTLGHEAGDSLLKEIANRLKSSLREHDIVARLGGDEFVVLLPEVTEETHASAVAHKILTTIGRPLVLLGQEFRITASVGNRRRCRIAGARDHREHVDAQRGKSDQDAEWIEADRRAARDRRFRHRLFFALESEEISDQYNQGRSFIHSRYPRKPGRHGHHRRDHCDGPHAQPDSRGRRRRNERAGGISAPARVRRVPGLLFQQGRAAGGICEAAASAGTLRCSRNIAGGGVAGIRQRDRRSARSAVSHPAVRARRDLSTSRP